MTKALKKLPRSFFARPTHEVARDLIGKIIVRSVNGITLKARITETEAYGHTDDPASHAYKGMTKRAQSMFGPVGHAYVYFIYGNHYCLNVVARQESAPAGGVLIRAIQPIANVSGMQKLRPHASLKNLANGPGKLTQALAIDKSFDGHDMLSSTELHLCDDQISYEIKSSVRIGITRAVDLLWRFYISI